MHGDASDKETLPAADVENTITDKDNRSARSRSTTEPVKPTTIQQSSEAALHSLNMQHDKTNTSNSKSKPTKCKSHQLPQQNLQLCVTLLQVAPIRNMPH
jgi:hypothetical protein